MCVDVCFVRWERWVNRRGDLLLLLLHLLKTDAASNLDIRPACHHVMIKQSCLSVCLSGRQSVNSRSESALD